MNLSAGILVKITIKQEILEQQPRKSKKKHNHKTNIAQNNLEVAASVLAFFIKNVAINQRRGIKKYEYVINMMPKIIKRNFTQSNILEFYLETLTNTTQNIKMNH